MFSFYVMFIFAMVAGGISSGILTLIPAETIGFGGGNMNYIGYYSICSFAPYSSLMLLIMALIGIYPMIKIIQILQRKFSNLNKWIVEKFS